MAPKDFDPQLSSDISLDTQSGTYSKTGSGLDYLVEQALKDPGLNLRVTDADIKAGTMAAAGMNELLIMAIKATGAANDGSFSAADVHLMSDWIHTNHFATFKKLHGNDENNVETGYHLIQNDGASLNIFGDNLINQVADSIYHIGFKSSGNRLRNEDGNDNARAEKVAFWLNDIMKADLADGSLANPSKSAMTSPTSGTGLDAIVDLVTTDAGLDRHITGAEINEGAAAADTMNKIIIEGIKALGLADDKNLLTSEVYDLADWISANRLAEFKAAHGDDEGNVETAYHLVQGDGGAARLFGQNAVDTVADAIYHLGFGYRGDRLVNEDGDTNQRVELVTEWLNQILHGDLQAGTLATGKSTSNFATTGTGLDQLTDLISNEAQLNRRLPRAEVEAGAQAADAMNKIVVDGIKALGLANNGALNVSDIMDLSDWIVANHKAAWKVAHGDDENGKETGFHLVQGDGAATRSFSHNAVDTVADGIYHLGFGYKNGVVINEDGQGNARLSSTAHWLNQLLASDLNSGALTNNSVDPYPTGTTGTGLDQMVDLIVNDPGLARNYKTSELAKIATDVDGLNKILLKGIAATGIGKDGSINAIEIEVLGQWIKKNAISEWSKLRGDDDAGTGVMGLVWKGGVSQISDANAFNYFANTVYSLGYTQRYGGIVDEDDDWNGVAVDAAKWLTDLLAADLSEGSQGGASIDPSSFADALVVENGPVNVTDDDNYSVLSNASKLKLSEGTVSFSFIAEDPTPKSTQVLFSKDAKGSNEGDVRIYFYDNQLYAKLSKAGKDHYVTIPENISPGEAHDVAFTFGSDGAAFWLDGILVEYDANIKINWLNNSNDIVIGASNEHQSANDPTNISSHFQGEVSNFQVYDRVLNRDEIESLSFGVTSIGTTSDDNMAGSNGQDALHGDLGQDVLSAGDGDDALYGGYGADMLKGGAGDDILDGGHGQDELMGGAGDDILLSTSDGREQTPAQLLPGYSKEPRPDNGDLDPATLKLYPNQPIAADDTLTGGSGADTFRFQFMINAKYGIIQKHARSDGSINWRGVAGENTYVHDHWVDMIGKDTITDFNRAEGDRIEIAGHTLNVEYINYHDSNSDGVDDYTIISFISKQGNGGGAHDQDDLGSLTVYGDLVTMADVTQIPSATVFYGIVETIADIDEAITPLDTDPGTPRNAASPAVAQVNGPRGTADTTGQAAVSSNNVAPASRSGTGLDQLLDWIETDPGLSNRISDKDISEGSKSAAAMNGIVLEAIKATGAGNDNKIDAGDVYAMADWIKANRLSDWKKYHGDDENDVETAFHLVQGDGSAELAFGRNGINTVADAIYHLGFGYRNGRLINEDGKENERVEAVAYWLDQLLEGDLRNGSLSNGGPGAAVNGTTGTGLDQLVDIIMDDEQLNRKLPNSEHDAGAKSADTMNKILVDGIKSLGLANDGTLTTSDVMALANHIKANHFAAWKAAHGDDEKSTETGFHLVQGDGAKARLFGSNAVDTVADGIYHIGFGYKNRVLVDEDGNQNAWVETVTYWLNQLLEANMSKLANPSVDPTPGGTTGTGLDQLVDLIQGDTGLNRKISLGEINGAADAANAMNDIIVKSIKATGVGNNSEISVGDVMVLADYIKSNHFNAWKAAHGDDEKGVETGFHKAQGDGGHARLFGSAGVDTVADGIYHLGFGYKNGALLNEDGNGNASLSDVAGWLTGLLKSDLADGSLNNPDKTLYVSGSTGTGLDVLVNMVTADVGLAGALKTNKISKAATAADQMNKILVEGIKATGIANDGKISSLDVIDLDAWMKANYHAEHLKLNGAQGFDVVEIWNATSPLFGADGVNEVADAIYSIGFGTKWGNSLFDEKGNWTETLDNTAAWLNGLLAQDLGAGTLHSASSGFSDPASFSSDIVASPGTVNADGVAGHLNVNHTNALALANGTVSFDFQANSLPNSDTVTLFSKDARGLGSGGQTQLYLDNGEMWLRMQSATGTKYYGAQLDDTIKAGGAYHVALTFGSGGLKLFVDGKKVLTEPNVKSNWKNNSEDIVFGGSGDWRNSKYPDHVHSVLDGAMSNIAIYNRALTPGEVAGLYGVNSDIVGAQPGEGTTPPVDQAPVDPTPVDPVPSDPTPSDPAPTDSAPFDPAPATPIPDPTPTDQAPVDTTPAPTNPAPATPTPSNPEPAPSAPTTPVDNGGVTLKGDAGDNKLTGTSKNDRIEGGDGNDKIFGGDGDDYIAAGAGRDGYVRGGTGLDIFEFSRGDGDIKIFDWQDSSDKIQLAGGLKFTDLTQSYSTYQGIGTITFATSSGDRLMFRDQKIGDINEGDFISSAGGGVAAQTASAPLVSGGFSPDDYNTQFVGTNADDPYQGSSGRDWIEGSDGNDKINGNAGDDYIIAGAGKDGYVRGGTGSDIFQFSMGDGDVKIFDWEDGFDAIKLAGGLKFGDLKVSTSQHNGISTVVYSTSVGDRLMFRDEEVGNIDANDFI